MSYILGDSVLFGTAYILYQGASFSSPTKGGMDGGVLLGKKKVSRRSVQIFKSAKGIFNGPSVPVSVKYCVTYHALYGTF